MEHAVVVVLVEDEFAVRSPAFSPYVLRSEVRLINLEFSARATPFLLDEAPEDLLPENPVVPIDGPSVQVQNRGCFNRGKVLGKALQNLVNLLSA
jgi:hypothetical protein